MPQSLYNSISNIGLLIIIGQGLLKVDQLINQGQETHLLPHRDQINNSSNKFVNIDLFLQKKNWKLKVSKKK